jgi:hypothetical protein
MRRRYGAIRIDNNYNKQHNKDMDKDKPKIRNYHPIHD